MKEIAYRAADGSTLYAASIGDRQPLVVLLHGGGPDHHSLVPRIAPSSAAPASARRSRCGRRSASRTGWQALTAQDFGRAFAPAIGAFLERHDYQS